MTGENAERDGVLAAVQHRLEHDREAYIDECITELHRAGSYLAVAIAVVAVGWVLGMPLESPSGTFGSPIGLAIVAGLGFGCLKPVILDEAYGSRFVDWQWRARSLVAIALLVAMLGFGATATGGSAGIKGVTDIANGLVKFGIVGLAVVVPLLFVISWPVLLAGIMGVGGGVIWAIFTSSVDPPKTILFVAPTIAMFVVSATLIDRRLLDRGAVLAAVGVGLPLFILVTDPSVTIPAAVAAAVFASGFRFESGYEPYPRSSSIVGSLPERADSLSRKSSESAVEFREQSPALRFWGLLGASRKYSHKLSRWRLLLLLIMLVLSVPLLWIPGLLVVSYLFRLTATAAAGRDNPPNFTLLGRRGALKEGIFGTLLAVPFIGVVVWLTPPIITAVPVLGEGESAVRPAAFAAELTAVFTELGVPAVPISDPRIAGIGIGITLALLPVPLVSYASGGRLRDGLNPRRYRQIMVNRRYIRALAVQVFLLSLPVVLYGGTLVLTAFFLLNGGAVGGVVILYLGSIAAIYLFTRVLVTSAFLWGLYWQQITRPPADTD